MNTLQEDPERRLAQALAGILPLDEQAMEAARARQAILTKPTGSLGRLEELAVRVAGITSNPLPTAARKAVVVMAGDHGVAAEGVSAYPAEVTPQMVLNFLCGGAAINALAAQVGARVVVVDVGVAHPISHPALLERNVARGTANMATGPAMTRGQAFAAIVIGLDVLEEQAALGLDIVATGDMGIGNTTAASAITAALTGAPVASVTGRGTGLDDRQLAHKIAVVERALAVNAPDPTDPLDVLCKVGGLEIAALVGVMLGAAARNIPVVVDGFISGAAALVACGLCSALAPHLIAGHVSVERGHRIALAQLGLRPILDLEMRLGEGTGAALAMGIVEAALRAHREMATFAEAGVSEKSQTDSPAGEPGGTPESPR